LSKTCLLNIRDDNAFISPEAIDEALRILSNKSLEYSHTKLPIYFHNYFIIDQEFVNNFPEYLNQIVKDSHTEFQFHKLTIDADERKNLINEILKDFSQRVLIPLNPSQKSLGQVLIEPMTLVACYSFVFRPNQSESWEQLW